MHSILRTLWHTLDSSSESGSIFYSSAVPSIVAASDMSQDLMSGDGRNGNITLDGNAGTVPTGFSISGSGSSAIYTMTDHINALNLTVSSGITLKPGGYFLRVRENVILGDNVTISFNGANASGNSQTAAVSSGFFNAGSYGGKGQIPGIAGLAYAGGTVSGIKLGGTGGTGGGTTSAAYAGVVGNSTNSWTKTNGDRFVNGLQGFFINGTAIAKIGGGSGGTGGNNGSADTNYCGGAGGSGAGVIIILIGGTITFGTGCSITAIGGNGADAVHSSNTGFQAGGGGGGGGGVVILKAKKKVGSVTINVSGGTGGVGWQAENGSNGSAGYSKELYTS